MEVRDLIQDYNSVVIKNNEPNCFCSQFQYRNGVHLLFIHKSNNHFYLCGLNTGFHVLCHKTGFDIYQVYTSLIDAVRDFERFVCLLLMPRKYETPLSADDLQKSLFEVD